MGTFSTCPKKFKLQYIEKIKVESEPKLALYRGSFAHEILEHNFNYDIAPKLNEVFTQEEADKVIEMIKEFRNTPLGKATEKMINHPSSVREEDFAFNSNLELVDFWDKYSWMRGSSDLYNVDIIQPLIVDYKTGKDKSDDPDFGYEQGMVYAIYLFIKFPKVMSVKAVFIFIEHSTKKEIFYNRGDFAEYIRKLYDKTKKIENTEIFKENVSALCLFCDYHNTAFCTSYIENEEKSNNIMKSKISLDF
jgi:CRISPR/Cas system-associated exonuclease Cas4 (RecB family)